MINEFFKETVWEEAWKEDQQTAVNKMKKPEWIKYTILTLEQSHSMSKRLTKKGGKGQNGL